MKKKLLALCASLLMPCAALGTQYANVAIVAKAGGDYTDPTEAFNALESWCPKSTRSAENPCLVKIMPGTWEFVNTGLFMKDHVDVEGSGASLTTLRGSLWFTVRYGGEGKSELRSLTVENVSTGESIGIDILGAPAVVREVTVRSRRIGVQVNSSISVNVVLDRVSVFVTGSSTAAYAVAPSGYANLVVDGSTLVATGGNSVKGLGGAYPSNGGTITVSNSTIRASGGTQTTYGITLGWYREVALRNVKVSADGPWHVYGLVTADSIAGDGGTARVDASEISASSTWPYGGVPLQTGANSRILVGASRIDGINWVDQGARQTCAFSYTGQYGELGPNCLPKVP